MSKDGVSPTAASTAVEEIKKQESAIEGDNMVRTSRCSCGGQNRRAYVTVFVLFLINLLNYMDRQTVPGLLQSIQKYFDVNNSLAGLLQTVFVCSYMALAPVFGYLGDRYRRKYIMAAGILVWSGTVFASTMLGREHFWWFLTLRGVVGIGEASYSTIAPTLIADLFTSDRRTRMLSIFYFAIPVGSGLGYIVGSTVASAINNQWQWGLRVTPIFGALCVFLCIFVVHEPKRGAIERGENPNTVSASDVHRTSSWFADLQYLCTVKSFIWLNLGFTCVTFATGALAFWAPKFLLFATKVQGLDMDESDISFKFGIITCAAGIVGVWFGAEISWRYRVRNRRADALVCAAGLLGSAPFLYFTLVLATRNINAAFALSFFGEVLLFMNWAPVGDMLLYIIVPSRRSTAEAVQILFSHLFGDAGSPWLVGVISDRIRGSGESDQERARSMEYSLLMTTFISVLGGLCFIICSFYLVKDREKAEEFIRQDDDFLGTIASNHQQRLLGEENQALGDDDDDDDNDDNNDDDDDKLIECEPVPPTDPSDREALVVPVQEDKLIGCEPVSLTDPSDREALVVPVQVHNTVTPIAESNNHTNNLV